MLGQPGSIVGGKNLIFNKDIIELCLDATSDLLGEDKPRARRL